MDILIVEDEAQLADVIARNLRARGHAVRTEATAAGAIAAIERARPDTLLLDVNLPDLTGWDVLRSVDRRSRALMRAVVVSAGPISPKRLEEFRPDAHLEKPFPMDALLRVLLDTKTLEPAEEES